MMTLILGLVTRVAATSFYPIDIEKRVDDASLIVRGLTGKSYADWLELPKVGKRIYTFTPLTVTEVIKGELKSEQILVRELGGEVQGVGMRVHSTAKFQANEDVVLMLGPLSTIEGAYPLRGLMMSKLTVGVDADGREILTGPALDADAQAKKEKPADHEESHSHNDTDDLNDHDKASKKWLYRDFSRLVAARKNLPPPVNPNHSASTQSMQNNPVTAASSLQSQEPVGGREEKISSSAEQNDSSSDRQWTWWILIGIITLGAVIFFRSRF